MIYELSVFFKFGHNMTSFGLCYLHNVILCISGYFVSLNEEKLATGNIFSEVIG